ncbi:DUF2911 domain-containing protein [Maribacter sp. 2307ULW6-5]|uniref:DUF2911 domain-containing protein n=1 Tax=Maribacter sp. 2307ULW6-5 TaxID=3386275 RepID=UPI0039BD3235
MKVVLKILLALAIVLGLLYALALPLLRQQTKKNSPEKVTSYTFKGAELSVHYSSPSKKGRTIFGDLLPYGQVWRTGANEPTTFSTDRQIAIIDKILPKGTYSLWTVPHQDHWEVIFNKKIPDWGVTFLSGGKKTTRNPKHDVLRVQVPARRLDWPTEEFTIAFENNGQFHLTLEWDLVKVNVPINVEEPH